MRIALLADPAETLKVSMDTTLLVAGECNRRGHEVFYGSPKDLFLSADGPAALWYPFDYRLKDDRPPQDCLGTPFTAPTSRFDIVFMRQDPPVSEHYLTVTHMLDFSETPVINTPADVRSFNEKISVMRLPGICPPSIVSINPDQIADFVAGFPEGCVMKPLNLFNGIGVRRIRPGAPDLVETVREGTENFTKYVIVQKFVEDIRNGDKRVYLVEGKPIGRMNRVPQEGEWRANIHLGAQPRRFEMSARDEEIVAAVAGLLARYDMPIACIDIIGDYLTEINVTSPSGIPEINRIYGDGHEQPIVDCLERRARRR